MKHCKFYNAKYFAGLNFQKIKKKVESFFNISLDILASEDTLTWAYNALKSPLISDQEESKKYFNRILKIGYESL